MTEVAQNAPSAAVNMAELAGKYLTFVLANEEYGIEILHAQEIIGMVPVTPVPRTPAFVRGVINLRGKVIPTVDLRRKFGMDTVEDTERTCIVVVQVEGRGQKMTIGFVVDEVSEVLDIAAEDIEAPPSFGAGLDTSYILGMAKTKDSVKILIDIDKVLATEEIGQIQENV